MSSRNYTGPPIDGGYQHISERPSLEEQAEDVVYATEKPTGEERTEGVPSIAEDDEPARPPVPGQTTIGEWSQL